MSESVDVLAIGAHPDDVELNVGGSILLAKQLGLKVAIAHLTRGEMGTRGTPKERIREAEEAAQILAVDAMEVLSLADGKIQLDTASKDLVIRLLRRYRPKTVLCPHVEDFHPDHEVVGQLVRQASFLAGLRKWDTGQDPWRPEGLLHYMSHTPFAPTLIVDISEHFTTKRRAASCYGSQLFKNNAVEPSTYISGEGFWQWWEARARNYGHQIGVEFGEPYLVPGPIPFRNPFQIFSGFGKYRNS